MNHVLSAEEIAFNQSLDPREVLRKMGFADDAIAEEGDLIRLYCPIHKDQVRRSLIIERQGNRFKCQYKSCPAHRGGLLIELLALYLGVDVPEAIKQIREEEHPEKALIERADRLIDQGRLEEAIQLLEEARRLAPRDGITRCKLAALYLETGRREDGFREYLAAAEDYAVKNQIDKTLSIYNILVMLSPQDLRVRRQLAFLFSRLGRYREAAEHLKWATDQLITRGEVLEAVKVVRQIAELLPDEPEVHLLLARLLGQARRIGEAVAEAEKAAQLALEAGDQKQAAEAVTFGLIYNPESESLRRIEAILNQTPAPSDTQAQTGEEGDDFSEWLESLEAEVAGEEKKPTPTPSRPDSAASAVRREKWLSFCRQTLKKLDDSQLDSMGKHLRAMFENAQSSFQAGHLSEWEMNILRDFYALFCSAYDRVRKERSGLGGSSR